MDRITNLFVPILRGNDSAGTVAGVFLGRSREFWRMKALREIHYDEPLIVWATLMHWVDAVEVAKAVYDNVAVLHPADADLLLRACEAALEAQERGKL